MFVCLFVVVAAVSMLSLGACLLRHILVLRGSSARACVRVYKFALTGLDCLSVAKREKLTNMHTDG